MAKSRLRPLGEDARRRLVTAFAADTVAAAVASPAVRGVLVVTDDHRLAAQLGSLGADVVPDPVSEDLNATLRQAAAEAVRRWPTAAVAGLCADLPTLEAAHLTEALDAARGHRLSFVADAAGSGTTLLVGADVDAFRPRFGVGSRAAHRAEGAVELAAAAALRRDVDTPADLRHALTLGLGPQTSAAVTALGLDPQTSGGRVCRPAPH